MLTFAIKKKRTPSIAPKRHALTVSPMSHSLHLQQAKVRHILRSPTLQPKLTIGQPNDKYEQEADRVADEVMRMPEPRLRRQAEEEEEELIQTKPLAEQITPLVQRQMEEEEKEEEQLLRAKEAPGKTTEVTPDLESRIQALNRGGQPLLDSIQAFFEPCFGHDLSQVRIHTDAGAVEATRTLNAQALTIGQDIMFGKGRYAPETTDGKRLLAHELVHVVQQGFGGQGADVQRFPVEKAALKTAEEEGAEEIKTGLLGQGEANDFLEQLERLLGQVDERLGLIYASDRQLKTVSRKIEMEGATIQNQYQQKYDQFSGAIEKAGVEKKEFETAVVSLIIAVVVAVATAYAWPAIAPMLVAFEKAGHAVGGFVSKLLSRFVAVGLSRVTTTAWEDALTSKIWDGVEQNLPIDLIVREPLNTIHDISKSLSQFEMAEMLMNSETNHTRTHIRAHLKGVSVGFPADQIRRRVGDHEAYYQRVGPSLNDLKSMLNAIEEYESVNIYEKPYMQMLINRERMYQDIWIMWLSSLDENNPDHRSAVDDVEGPLEDAKVIGHGSRLGIEFGIIYTSEDDIRRAISEAKWRVLEIKRVYLNAKNELMSEIKAKEK